MILDIEIYFYIMPKITYLKCTYFFTKPGNFQPNFLPFILRNGEIKTYISKCEKEENKEGQDQHHGFNHHLDSENKLIK